MLESASALVARYCVLALLLAFSAYVQADSLSSQMLSLNERVLIYHDPQLSRPRVEIGIPAGSFQEPEAVPGLAHLIEHLVLRSAVLSGARSESGSGRAPAAGSEQSLRGWLQAHGSQPEASTGYDNTRFSFDIGFDHLAPALGHWRNALTKLRISAPVLQSEVAVIDAEFHLRAQQPRWRERDILTSQVSAGHPWRRWHPGNRATFGQDTKQLQAAARQFHQQFYTHATAYLMVAGPQPLEQLRDLVQASWDSVPATAAESPARSVASKSVAPKSVAPKTEKRIIAQPGQVEIQASRQRELTLLYLPPVVCLGVCAGMKSGAQMDVRIARLAQRLLREALARRDTGSLFKLLQQAGWVTALAAGPGMSLAESNSFQISVALTPLGWQRKQQVIGAIERYLQHLAEAVPSEVALRARAVAANADWHAEMAALKADQRFQRLASLWARGAQLHEPISDAQFDAFGSWLQAWVASLAAHRLAVLLDTDVDGQARTPVFGTRYNVLASLPQLAARGLDVANLKVWPTVRREPRIAAVQPGLQPELQPMALDAGGSAIWLWPRSLNRQVTTQVALASLNPNAQPAPAALRALQLEVLASRLEARQAELQVRWVLHDDQIELALMGSASAVLNALILLAAQELERAASVAEFAQAQRQVLQRWRARGSSSDPFFGLYQRFLQSWYPHGGGRAARVEKLMAMTVEEFNRAGSIWEQTGVAATLITGIGKEDAEPLVDALRALTEIPSQEHDVVSSIGAQHLMSGRVSQPITTAVDAHQAFVWCQVSAEHDIFEEAIMRVARPLLHQYFFADLRSERGAGYGIFVTDFSLGDRHVLSFNAESSTVDADQLLAHTRNFLAGIEKWWPRVSNAALRAAQEQARARLERELSDQQIQRKKLWRAVRQGENVVAIGQRQQALVSALDKVSLADLQRYLIKYWVTPGASARLATGDSRSSAVVEAATASTVNSLGSRHQLAVTLRDQYYHAASVSGW